MKPDINCGQAVIKLLEAYGVDTVYGVPGVHTLEFCRGLNGSGIRHVQVRNEQGAGFMADGFARASGRPGVAMVISGPGVTNALTAIGQAYADSIPVLLLSSDTASYTHGKGWGCLHEVPNLTDVTATQTAFSACAGRPRDVPELIGKAFSIFASERPRPVHIAIPIDVIVMPVTETWHPVQPPARPRATPESIQAACRLLRGASRPLICIGGGAAAAGAELTAIAEKLNAAVVCSTAGKGIVADDHPLSLGGSTVRPEVQNFISDADVVLAIGTEISETDSFIEKLDLSPRLIRVDIDPRQINGLYPAEIGIIADAASAADDILRNLGEEPSGVSANDTAAQVRSVRAAIAANLSDSERRHATALNVIRDALPTDAIVMGDACQLAYTGAFVFDVTGPKQWHYAAGYCTLGCALPDAIGAKLALPERPVAALAGDGGFMFTVQELVTAAELKLGLPVIIWENGGLKQIQDDMTRTNIPYVGVEGINPDFSALARAMHCHAAEPDSAGDLHHAVRAALSVDRPTVITLRENADWLL